MNRPSNLKELIEYWDTPDTHPYTGSLINIEDYYRWGGDGDPPLSCMCAQGQILCVLQQTDPLVLSGWEQFDADHEVAKLLNISICHAVLLRNVNDNVEGAPGIVLTNPKQVLGENWSKILDFWAWLDTQDPRPAPDFKWSEFDHLKDYCSDKIWNRLNCDLFDSVNAATNEIYIGKPGYFLELLGLTLDTIPPRDADYGPDL